MRTPQLCICCNSPQNAPHLRGLRRCAQCSHVWADLRLSHEELKRLYSREYFEGSEYLNYEDEYAALARNFRGRLSYLSQRKPKCANLWEIGAAYGFFLAEARAYFSVAGCDISEHATAYARDRLGLNVVTGDYLQMPAQPAMQDVICLWDTVEHLQEPQLYLEKAHVELKPGGILGLSTGDIGSIAARLRGEKWRLIHPPTHLHYFSSNSIMMLLQRLGYTNIRISHPAFWRSADAVAYRLLSGSRETGVLPGMYRWMRKTGVLNFYFPLNTFDLMTVWAEKPPV